jgi:N-acetylmuramoyl-L-alanine amidase
MWGVLGVLRHFRVAPLRHRTGRRRCALALAVVLALGFAAGAAEAASSIVTDIRIGAAGKTTRIVFEFTERMSVRLFTLAEPYRIVIDMPEVGWRLPPKPLPAASGVYERLRYGLYKPGNSRVVLDLSRPARVDNAALIAPNGAYGHRLVVELTPTTPQAFAEAHKAGGLVIDAPTQLAGAPAAPAPPPPTPKPASVAAPAPVAAAVAPAPAPSVAATQPIPAAAKTRFEIAPRKPALRPSRERYTVMIDPGHGGVDPGTIGVSGIYEKQITLAMARAISEALESTGRFKVVLTRERDIFIRLRDRIQIAREAKADLFISIHADTIKDKDIRGPSVYTLSERASDTEAQALADKENKADLIAGIDLTGENADVTGILIDLAQRETMNQSARFAGMLVDQLKKRTKVLRNTHRFAGFAVLKAPDVPSVLLELGFLSNPADERALRDRRYRARIADGVARAIEGYFTRVEQASGN